MNNDLELMMSILDRETVNKESEWMPDELHRLADLLTVIILKRQIKERKLKKGMK